MKAPSIFARVPEFLRQKYYWIRGTLHLLRKGSFFYGLLAVLLTSGAAPALIAYGQSASGSGYTPYSHLAQNARTCMTHGSYSSCGLTPSTAQVFSSAMLRGLVGSPLGYPGDSIESRASRVNSKFNANITDYKNLIQRESLFVDDLWKGLKSFSDGYGNTFALSEVSALSDPQGLVAWQIRQAKRSLSVIAPVTDEVKPVAPPTPTDAAPVAPRDPVAARIAAHDLPPLATAASTPQGHRVRRLVDQGLRAIESLPEVESVSRSEEDRRSHAVLAVAYAYGADGAYAGADLQTGDQLWARGMQSLDVALGFVPVVGVINDAAQLAYGLVTGEDFSGQPVAGIDHLTRGVGITLGILPVGTLAKPLAKRLIMGGTTLNAKFLKSLALLQELGWSKEVAAAARNSKTLAVTLVNALADNLTLAGEILTTKGKGDILPLLPKFKLEEVIPEKRFNEFAKDEMGLATESYKKVAFDSSKVFRVTLTDSVDAGRFGQNPTDFSRFAANEGLFYLTPRPLAGWASRLEIADTLGLPLKSATDLAIHEAWTLKAGAEVYIGVTESAITRSRGSWQIIVPTPGSVGALELKQITALSGILE